MPDILINLAVGEHLASLLNQKAQDLVFNGGQAHALALHSDFSLGVVNDKIVYFIDSVNIGTHIYKLGISAQLRFDPCQEL